MRGTARDGVLDGKPVPIPPMLPAAEVGAYALALAIAVFAILSPYVLPPLLPAVRPLYHSFLPELLIVYGLPILAFLILVGAGPIRRFAASFGKAAVEGLRWYGLFSALSFLVTFAVLVSYALLDPAALRSLSQANPAIEAARSNPWFWIGFSFVVGAAEETIFRGWIFGYWLSRGTPSWVGHAIWTSALFAAVHLYYGRTYGAAVGAVLPTLFLLGLSFAVAFRYSGGNLVIVALLHGGYDATSFLTLISTPWADALRFAVVGLGLLIALAVFLRGRTPSRSAATAWVGPSMGAGAFPPSDAHAIERGPPGGSAFFPVGGVGPGPPAIVL